MEKKEEGRDWRGRRKEKGKSLGCLGAHSHVTGGGSSGFPAHTGGALPVQFRPFFPRQKGHLAMSYPSQLQAIPNKAKLNEHGDTLLSFYDLLESFPEQEAAGEDQAVDQLVRGGGT